MAKPPLANPVMKVAISHPDVTEAVKTSMSRVPLHTGIESPEVKPFNIVPTEIIPEREGLRVTAAPGMGEKTSLGVVERYNWALTVTVVPTRLAATATL